MVANETGHSSKEIHELFKYMFLPVGIDSTTGLLGKDVDYYLLRVQSFITQELGFIIYEE